MEAEVAKADQMRAQAEAEVAVEEVLEIRARRLLAESDRGGHQGHGGGELAPG